MTQKRKLHQTLPIGKRLKNSKPKPKHYDFPEGYACIKTITGWTRIQVLLDSGLNIFLINQNLVKNLHIPYETRQTALPILNFEGTNASYGGKHFTQPILLDIHQQKNTLRLMRRRCALKQATSLLPSLRPVRPEFRSNARKHPVLPESPGSAFSVLTRRHVVLAPSLNLLFTSPS